MEEIIESCNDGLFITDGDGNVIKVNKASLRLNDLKENDVIGKNVRDLAEEGFFDTSVTIKVLRKSVPMSFIQCVRSGRRLLVTGRPVFDDNGKIICVVTSERDVTCEAGRLFTFYNNKIKVSIAASYKYQRLKIWFDLSKEVEDGKDK